MAENSQTQEIQSDKSDYTRPYERQRQEQTAYHVDRTSNDIGYKPDNVTHMDELKTLRESMSLLASTLATQNKGHEQTMSTQGLKFPSFSGELHESFGAFVKTLDSNFTFLKWSDEAKRNYIPLVLQGRARIFYDNLEEQKKTTYEQLMQTLNEKFGMSRQKTVQQSHLFDRQQGTYEPVTSYTKDVLTNMQRLEITDETQMLTHFLRGLKPSIRLQVMSHRPSDISQAEEIALIIEKQEITSNPDQNKVLANTIQELQAIIDSQKKNNILMHSATDTNTANNGKQNSDRAINSPPGGSQQPRFNQPRTDSPFCRRCNQSHPWGIHVKPFPTQKNQVSNPRPQMFGGGTQSSYTAKPTGRQGACFNCGQQGHFAKFCPARNQQNLN